MVGETILAEPRWLRMTCYLPLIFIGVEIVWLIFLFFAFCSSWRRASAENGFYQGSGE